MPARQNQDGMPDPSLHPEPDVVSVLTCPHCGFAETLDMPVDACLFFHECARCHVVIRPNAGDCCVFCSFGSAKCPPVQVDGINACCRRPGEENE
jgi:hypothetical protein